MIYRLTSTTNPSLDNAERGRGRIISYRSHECILTIRSVEDQLILEDEYKCNPKPDKAARIRIVERVALSDREVQVRSYPAMTVHPQMLIASTDMVPESKTEHAAQIATSTSARSRTLSTHERGTGGARG